MSKLSRFIAKWGPGGIRRSIERKRARRQQRRLVQPAEGPQGSTTIDRLLLARYPQCQKLAVYRAPGPPRRVSVVTDSINAGSLYGGVGTALLLGALIANDRDAPLRLITRTEPAAPGNLAHVLDTAEVTLSQEPQFLFSPPSDEQPPRVDVHDAELFITTSWWTTEATLGTVPDSQILYLLQEDERMFYPFGDERLHCERTLSHPGIHFAINSGLLKDHLVQEGFSNISRHGVCFEPAFPRKVFQPRPREGERRRFMFYARPQHARNLFYFGLEVLREAVEQGLLDPRQWDIVMVGKDIPRLTLNGTSVIETQEGMSWQDYARFIGGVDVALSLMYTPHPSYPPLDLAVSGAWVVTNQFGNKESLKHYSDRIITKPLDIGALVEGLREAIDQCELHRGKSPVDPSGLGKDWSIQLRPVVEAARAS